MNLLFIHGAGGTPNVWAFQKEMFGGQFLDLHLGGGEKTVEAYADLVGRFCTGNGMRDVVLVGHSMGGAVAMMYALKYGAERLVLVGTGSRLRVSPQILEALGRNHEDACKLILSFAFAPRTSASLLDSSLREMLSVPQRVAVGDFEACNAFDISDRLGELEMPALIVCGTEDKMTPPKYSHFLAEKIAHSQTRIIEGAGHMVMLEHSREFNLALQEFLEAG